MASGRDALPWAVPSSLVRNDTSDARGLGEQTRLLQTVLAGGRIHHEKGLMRCAWNELLSSAAHLVELLRQVGLGMQASRRCPADEDIG